MNSSDSPQSFSGQNKEPSKPMHEVATAQRRVKEFLLPPLQDNELPLYPAGRIGQVIEAATMIVSGVTIVAILLSGYGFH